MIEKEKSEDSIKITKSAFEVYSKVVYEAIWDINGKDVRFRYIETKNDSEVLIYDQNNKQWIGSSDSGVNDEYLELIELIGDVCEFEDITDFNDSEEVRWDGEDLMYL